jgi:DNA-binding TFAR19-related protein (PDSD5 family)
MTQEELDAIETQKYEELKKEDWEHEMTTRDIAEQEKWQDYYREAKLGLI